MQSLAADHSYRNRNRRNSLERDRKGVYGIQAQICTFKRDNGIPED